MTLLEGKGLTKRFGGLLVLDNVEFALKQGEILGLIGPNGAGKTTLFNVITGFERPDSGVVKYKGRDITYLSPDKICKLGIARTFQLVRPFYDLTVFQNVLLGALYGRLKKKSKDIKEECIKILKFIGLYEKRDRLISELTLADIRFLELARALATNPEVLLLDEMAAGLMPSEIKILMKRINEIRDSGITIFMIEHVMKLIMNISDRIMVLDHGRKIAEGKPYEVANNKNVIEAYLGAQHIA